MAAWWGTRKEISPRLWMEVQAMRASFGDTFKLVVPMFGSNLYWEGIVEVNLTTVKTRSHTLRIVYPNEYPNRPPAAHVVRPNIYSPKHQYEDGQLCLFNPRDGEQYGWKPSNSTAVTVAAWAVQWLYAYYTYKATGQWPGIEESIYSPRNQDFPRRTG
jgi:ubiquitin-protein ligase